jgi:hypothetical protein
MNEDEVIKIIIGHLRGLFPKDCTNCQRRFNSLADFFANTEPMGNPVLRDFEAGDRLPEKPLGAVALSSCGCGATVALTSESMPLFQYWSVLLWVRSETRRRSVSVTVLLNRLRVEIRERVLAEEAARVESLQVMPIEGPPRWRKDAGAP